jgi:hypothetical protein
MAPLYRRKVEQLAVALQREDTRLEASEMLRGLIDSIVFLGGQVKIGNLWTAQNRHFQGNRDQ